MFVLKLSGIQRYCKSWDFFVQHKLSVYNKNCMKLSKGVH